MPGPLRLPRLALRRHHPDPAIDATAAPTGTPDGAPAASAVEPLGGPQGSAAHEPDDAGAEGPAGAGSAPAPVGRTPGAGTAPSHHAAACPSCGVLLDPAPARSRRCPSCRHAIVVRRLAGRLVYLTEAAVATFEAQRRREADEARWARERAAWLRLARSAGAPLERVERLADRHLDDVSVGEARSLYVAAARREIAAARRAHEWLAASRSGRELAAELHRGAGSPVPPSSEVASFHAAAMTALLRAVGGAQTHAELVGAACCPACRGDDGRAFRIAEELRVPRLPHAGCPRGLCACEWWIGVPAPRRPRRRATRSSGPPAG